MRNFFKRIASIFSKGVDAKTLDELERLLFEADLGSAMTFELVDKLKKYKPENPTEFIRQEIAGVFQNDSVTLHSPHVILMVGVNGSGKTTSLAKLASYYKAQGKSVLVAAGDTFRAAAIDQLEMWANKIGVEIVRAKPNSDPSGVAFDAVAKAKARHIDIVLIDTAGRLHTKTDLMQELAKIKRVSNPAETLLVLDASIGQNALDQAKTFHEATPLTGLILTKLDGTAKGGIAIALAKTLKVPIRWIGTGERTSDFAPFDATKYIDTILDLR